MTSPSINLLDLPEIVLEKIFDYCLKGNIQITEVNKFVKNFIENSSLMNRLVLKIHINFKTDQLNESEKMLQNCIGSTRKYKTVKCKVIYSEGFSNDTNILASAKKLLDRHAPTVRKLEFKVIYDKLTDVLKWLCLLESTMKNLEILKCRLNINYHRPALNGIMPPLQEFIGEEEFIVSCTNNFEKLKSFCLETEFSKSILHFIRNMKNLQALI